MNIAAHLPAMAAKQPDALAVAVQGGDNKYVTYTFRELETESNRLANGLVRAGIGRGVRSVLMVKPSLEFFALTFALFKAGAVPVLVDPGMGIANLKKCLAEAEPQAFIGIPKAHAARVVLGWGRLSLRTLVTVGRRFFWGGHTLGDLRRETSDAFGPVVTAPNETAAILFTSGSTGMPKGAIYTHEVFNAQVEILRRDYGIAPGERDLATFPLFALFGPALGMAAIVPDMDASKPAEADPKKIIAALRDHEATNMFASPALLDVVGRHAAEYGVKLPSLRRVISAGAPANLPSLARVETLLAPNIEVWPSYGSTEALPVAFIGTRELLGTAAATEIGAGVCVGKPVAEAVVRIIQLTDAPIKEWQKELVLPRGEIGEIAVQGPMVTQAYFNRPESTALAKIPDPETGAVWHRMGDLGYLDGAGRIWMCGRKSHRVVTAERTFFTIPCERIFNTHRAVRRTALVGVRHNGKVLPVICVEKETSVDVPDAAIVDDLRVLAQGHETTQGIETFLFHAKFPVDIRHNAKIFREKLAVWAERKLR